MEDNTINILNIDTDCTDNGVGIRTVIYVAGCIHACKNCHNKISWKKNAGIPMSFDKVIEKIMDNPIADVTISGGDPLTLQYEKTLSLLCLIKERTSKNIWLYTGFTIEEIIEEKRDLLEMIDVLVDGPYIEEQKDLQLQFRGSSNQRIIDVKQTLKSNSIVLWRNGTYR